MSWKEYSKCNPKKEKFCQVTRLERKGGHYGIGRGLFVGRLVTNKGEPKLRLVYQYSGKMREFDILRYCPVCGVKYE